MVTATASIAVGDVNDSPVIDDVAVSIGELASLNSLLIDLDAVDADHNDLVYTLVGGNAGNAFSIDAQTGEIRVANVLDYETLSSYVLQVEVTDGVGGIGNAEVSVTVLDVNDGSITGTIYEDIVGDGSVAGDVGIVSASVSLFQDNGNGVVDASDLWIDAVVTDSNGGYTFDGVANGSYYVVVDSRTLTPFAGFNAGFGIGNVWADQTYASAGGIYWDASTSSYGIRTTAGAFFGGVRGDAKDAPTQADTAQHVNLVSVGNDSVSEIDFGFSFNVVTNLEGGNLGSTSPDARTVQGSLRQFIQNANAIVGSNVMRFVPTVAANETSSGGNWWSLGVSSLLPSITDDATVIDGRAWNTDGVSLRNENQNLLGYAGGVGVGADGVAGTGDEEVLVQLDAPELEIYNANSLSRGLVVQASHVEVKHIAIHGFGTDVLDKGNIFVDGSSSPVVGVMIHHNVLGSSADKFESVSQQSRNISVVEADFGTIEYNLIGFSGGDAVAISGGNAWTVGAEDWRIAHNEIRDSGSGGSTQDAISAISGVTRLTVAGNLIVNTSGYGIDTWLSPGQNTISDNTLASNGWGGVHTSGIRLFGNGSTVTSNLIHSSGGAGVHVSGSNTVFVGNSAAVGNLISKNSFYGNQEVAIDLGASSSSNLNFTVGDGVSDNSVDDAGAGNDGLDFPELTTAFMVAGKLHVRGTISPSSSIDRLEFYAAEPDLRDFWNSQPYGEGKRYLGSSARADFLSYDAATGDFEAVLSAPVDGWANALGASEITSLAFDTTQNTSEFSQNVALNQQPIFQSASEFLSFENQTDIGDVVVSDANGHAVTYSLAGGPDAGRFAIDPNSGTLTWMLPPDFENPSDVDQDNLYEMVVQVDDQHGGVVTQEISVQVVNVNEAPAGVDDVYSVNEGGALVVGNGGVLQNDSDPDSHSGLKARLLTGPEHGSLVLNEDGSFRYKHDGGETLADGFFYDVYDAGGLADTAYVSLIVQPIDDPTQAVDDSFTMTNTNELTIQSSELLANDIDPDTSQNDMGIVLVTPPENGELQIVDGVLTYVPTSAEARLDHFEYAVIANGVRGNAASVTIEILVGGLDTRQPDNDNEIDSNEDSDDSSTDDGDSTEDPLEEDSSDSSASGGGPSETAENPSLSTGSGPSANSQEPWVDPKPDGDSASGSDQENIDSYMGNGSGTYFASGNHRINVGIFELASSLGSTHSTQLTVANQSVLASLFLDELDESKNEFLMDHEMIGFEEFAASTASLLTVGYLAWIIRGGVILTTFMSSIPTWNALDIGPLIESANQKEEDDESIEQMVDE